MSQNNFIDPNTVRKKVVNALAEVVSNGNQVLIDKLWADPYIQHNPIVDNGRDTLKNLVESVDADLTPIRAVAEDGIVAVQSVFTGDGIVAAQSPDAPGSIVMDILRLNEEGLIVEHWDVIQPIVTETANSNTMIDGGSTQDIFNNGRCWIKV